MIYLFILLLAQGFTSIETSYADGPLTPKQIQFLIKITPQETLDQIDAYCDTHVKIKGTKPIKGATSFKTSEECYKFSYQAIIDQAIENAKNMTAELNAQREVNGGLTDKELQEKRERHTRKAEARARRAEAAREADLQNQRQFIQGMANAGQTLSHSIAGTQPYTPPKTTRCHSEGFGPGAEIVCTDE